MNLIAALILGLIQGVTEFLPVSSTGHISILGILLGLDAETLEVSAFLHIGTMVAVCMYFQQDILRLTAESVGFLAEAFGNFKLWIRARRTNQEVVYQKLIRTNYRKMAVMIMAATPFSALVGLMLRHAASFVSKSALGVGASFFVTGLILMVSDMVQSRNLIPKDISIKKSVLIGILQGIAVIPGLSRAAVTITASSFAGLNRKNAVRFAYLLSVPTIFGAMIAEMQQAISFGDFNAELLTVALPGMVVAAVVGYYTVRLFLKSLRRQRFTPFALYCFAAGALSMAIHFIK